MTHLSTTHDSDMSFPLHPFLPPPSLPLPPLPLPLLLSHVLISLCLAFSFSFTLIVSSPHIAHANRPPLQTHSRHKHILQETKYKVGGDGGTCTCACINCKSSPGPFLCRTSQRPWVIAFLVTQRAVDRQTN